MSGRFKKTNTATTLALVFSMILPSVGAAAVVQPRSAAAQIAAAITAPPPFAEATKVDHRPGHLRRGQNDRRVERRGESRRDERRRIERRIERRDDRRARRYDRETVRYRRGYRGSRDYRRGYRRDNDGWWFPLAAFALGAVILNETANNNRSYSNQGSSGWSHIPYRNMAAHDNWCDQRYRSYSRSSKTFQPYNGSRRFCNSPYDNI